MCTLIEASLNEYTAEMRVISGSTQNLFDGCMMAIRWVYDDYMMLI
jgi:hypothetical protein